MLNNWFSLVAITTNICITLFVKPIIQTDDSLNIQGMKCIMSFLSNKQIISDMVTFGWFLGNLLSEKIRLNSLCETLLIWVSVKEICLPVSVDTYWRNQIQIIKLQTMHVNITRWRGTHKIVCEWANEMNKNVECWQIDTVIMVRTAIYISTKYINNVIIIIKS